MLRKKRIVLAILLLVSSGVIINAQSISAKTPAYTPCERDAVGGVSYYAGETSTANATRVIGRSSKGRPIIAEHWGPHSGPQILVIGQVHGDECTPAYLVKELRENPITSKGLWIIPTLNPDGLMLFTRFDSKGRDLNRDGYRRQAPETRALLKFTATVKPALSLHLHSPYGWIGQYNGGSAARFSAEVTRRARWGNVRYAGGGLPNGMAFLWEGQNKVLAEHPSVLVEFPAISKLEAPGAPRRDSVRYASKAEVIRVAKIMREALQDLKI